MVRQATRYALLLTGLWAATAVLAAPAAGLALDLQLVAEVTPAQVLVQAQAVYRLRFYQAVDVQDLKLNGPSTHLADVRQIGAERRYEALRDGRRYRVSERSYAVFPFSSGPLELAGAHVLGRIAAVAAKSGDGRQALRLDAPAQTLTVLPVPAAAGAAPWLPARSLTLSDSWSENAVAVHPGQTLTRRIRIEATGVDAKQIPQLQFFAPGHMVISKPPRLKNTLNGDLNIGVSEQDFEFLALRPGEFLVPEIELQWWNLRIGGPDKATLAARSIHVSAATGLLQDVQPTVSASAQPNEFSRSRRLLPHLTVAGLLCACLAAIYFLRHHIRAAWRLGRACRSGSPASVRDSLTYWMTVAWPAIRPLSLDTLSKRFSDQSSRSALAIIDRCLYGPPEVRCDANMLIACVRVVTRGGHKGPYENAFINYSWIALHAIFFLHV